MNAKSPMNTAPESTPNEAEKTREALDRRIFHLKTVSDLNAELSPLIRTEKLLETFLLVTMGTFGIQQGFALAYDREAQTARTAVRGMDRSWDLKPRTAEKLLYACFGASEDRSLAPMSMTRIPGASECFSEAGPGGEMDLRTGLLYVVDSSCLGVLGFGPTLAGAALSPEEEELLRTHTASFMVFLKNARSFERIEALNKDLVQRNEELRKTIAELKEARHTIVLLEKAGARIKSFFQGEMERIGRVNPLDIVLIWLLACVLGVLFNSAGSQGIHLMPETLFRPSAPPVDVVEARQLMEAGKTVLVDARPKELYSRKHIGGAINLPPALFDILYTMKLANLDSETGIIVYGRTISKLYDEEVAYRLKQRDHEAVRVLSGGLSAWEAQGYSVEQGKR